MEQQDPEEIPLLSQAEAIAEVRRWLDTDKVDPDAIFSAAGDQIIRYKDLVAHLEQETPDGKLLRFAISRGRAMKGERSQMLRHLLQIAPSPAGGEGQAADPASSDNAGPPRGRK